MESLTISCNKELMFSERALHPGDIPWTAFLSYPNGSAPLPSLDLQPVSASHSGKPRCAVLLQGWSRCPWFPIPTNKWALGWAHKHWWDQPWPAHACQRVPRTLFLAMDLIWTHHIAQKLQLRRHLKHSHYTLSTLFLNTCKKIPLPLQKEKKNLLLPLASVSTLLPHFSLPCGGGGGNCCCYWDARDYATV